LFSKEFTKGNLWHMRCFAYGCQLWEIDCDPLIDSRAARALSSQMGAFFAKIVVARTIINGTTNGRPLTSFNPGRVWAKGEKV
jgi:hypothetical protein